MSEATNDTIDYIAEQIGKLVPALIKDMRDKINEAAVAAVEEAEEAEKRPVLSIPIAIKWALDERSIDVSVTVNSRTKKTVDLVIPDPNQLGLDFDGNAKDLASDILIARDMLIAAGLTEKKAGEVMERVSREQGLPPVSQIRATYQAMQLRDAVEEWIRAGIETVQKAKKGGVQ